jgi:3-hydroxyisobutyrate dehydrogenase-like beta-hydroxyacid dehydrogenase
VSGERIGIIGLGLVGSALAERLMAAGFDVSGYDINPARVEEFQAAGGASAPTALEAARGCPLVLLSLPTSEIGAAVIEQIEPGLAPGVTVVDTTTGEPEQMAAFGARLAGRGVFYLDASIGGSSKQVRDGEAMVICGGEPEAFAACGELFRVCFRQAFHVGECGGGARMKLVLNLVLGLNRAVLAEGLSYARACGVDPARALEVLKAGPAYSRAMDVKGHKMLGGDFTPEARLTQHLKDVRLILKTAEAHGARVPLSTLHRQLLEEAEAAGHGAADNSAIINVFARSVDPEKEKA